MSFFSNNSKVNQLSASLAEIALNVKNFGAVGDGSTPDTTAIQNAIDSANASGGGIVFLPQSTYMVSTIKLRSKVLLIGAGHSTIIKSIANNPNNAIIQLYDQTQDFVGVMSLTIDGNKANQTIAVDGVLLNNNTWNDPVYFDHHNLFKDLMIQNCKGNGFNMPATSRENRLINIKSMMNDGTGFILSGTDNYIELCTAGNTGSNGFYVNGSNMKLTTCKAFYAGNIDSTNNGDGFVVYNARDVQFSNCEAQNNGRHGFYLKQATGFVGYSLVSDTNARLNTNGYGVIFDSGTINSIFKGLISNRTGISGNQPYAITINDAASLHNTIDVRVYTDDKVNKPIDWVNNNGIPNVGNSIIVNGVNANIKNIFPTPDLILDSNSDGLSDNLTASATNTNVTGTASMDLHQQCQKLSITANTAGASNGTWVRYDVPVIAGQILSAKANCKVDNTTNVYMQVSVAWYNGTTYISSSFGNQITNLQWDSSVVVNAVAPVNATIAQVRLTLVSNGNGMLGNGWVKDLYVGKTV